MKCVTIAALAAAFGAVAALAGPAGAVTVAQFYAAPNSSIPDFLWEQDASGAGGTLTAVNEFGQPGAPVEFNFQTLAGMSNLPAVLTFTGVVTGTPATNYGGQFLAQYGLSGSFEFAYAGTTPLVYNGKTYTTGADLLSGTFSSANINGQVNASSGNVDDATSSGDKLSLVSDVLSLAPGDRSYSLSLTSISPKWNAGSGMSPGSFEALGTGSFEANLNPGPVPEPATWAMVIMGLAGMGGILRRRNSSFVPA